MQVTRDEGCNLLACGFGTGLIYNGTEYIKLRKGKVVCSEGFSMKCNCGCHEGKKWYLVGGGVPTDKKLNYKGVKPFDYVDWVSTPLKESDWFYSQYLAGAFTPIRSGSTVYSTHVT